MYSALKAYQQSQVQRDVNPVKLIHMAYEGILDCLVKAEEGIDEGNVQKRGENLSRAIGLITELNVAVRSNEGSEDESALFLKGLYETILTELPKVSLNEDKEILRRSYRYIARLKEIWEETAMKEQGLTKDAEQPLEPQTLSRQSYQDGTGYASSGISTSI